MTNTILSNKFTLFQSSKNSIGFCAQYSIPQAVNYLFQSLKNLQTNFCKIKKISVKISRNMYVFKNKLKFYNLKYKLSINLYKTNLCIKKYLKQYWIFKILSQEKSKIYKFSKYLQIFSFEVKSCFENVSHDKILELIPLTNKYLYFIKQWLNVKIVECNKVNKLTFKKGISSNFIIGPLICDLILDDFVNLLGMYKNRKFTFLADFNKSLQTHFEKTNQNSNVNIKVKFDLIRCGDIIVVFGLITKSQMLILQKIVIAFFKNYGLNINSKKKKIFTFKPGISFNYLGYKFVFPNRFNKQLLNKGRFTKLRYTLFNFILGNNLFQIMRNKIYVIIAPCSYKNITKNIKSCLSLENYYIDIKLMIKKMNTIFLKAFYYFRYSTLVKIQLKKLNYLIYKWFWKYLKKKYQSKPKLSYFLKFIYVYFKNKFAENKNYNF